MEPTSSPESAGSSTTHSHFTLSSLLSMPSLQLNSDSTITPSSLMAIKLESPRKAESPMRISPLPRIEDESIDDTSEGHSSTPAIRLKYAPRPRSYIQILEDFQEHASSTGSPISTRLSVQSANEAQFVPDERDEIACDSRGEDSSSPNTPASSLPPSPRKEDTVRRRKRFSLPALALHTSPVTTRPAAVGDGKGRRVSLVLGRSSAPSLDGQSSFEQYDTHGLRDGAAAGKLNEILLRGGQS